MATKICGGGGGKKRKKHGSLYLKIGLEFENEVDFGLTAVLYEYVIKSALESLHGQVGAAISVDIEEFDSDTLEAIIGIPADCLVKVWSALTLFGCYQGERCMFVIEKVSSLLTDASVVTDTC